MNAVSSPADDPVPAISEERDTEPAVASPTHKSLSTQKHTELLEALIQSLDALLYIELTALYYLDCAFGLFILRILVQLFLLTAWPLGFPEPPMRSALGTVVGSNIFCTLFHLLNARPQAGEATRLYLHGSILIDFVGQLGPTSKWKLFGIDTLVLALQVLMLGLGVERRRVQNKERTLEVPQDLEAEEAGIRNSRTLPDETDEGIEMRELIAEGGPGDEAGRRESNTHPLDNYYSGNTILVSLNVFDTISREIRGPTNASGSTSSGRVSIPGLFIRWRSLG